MDPACDAWLRKEIPTLKRCRVVLRRAFVALAALAVLLAAVGMVVGGYAPTRPVSWVLFVTATLVFVYGGGTRTLVTVWLSGALGALGWILGLGVGSERSQAFGLLAVLLIGVLIQAAYAKTLPLVGVIALGTAVGCVLASVLAQMVADGLIVTATVIATSCIVTDAAVGQVSTLNSVTRAARDAGHDQRERIAHALVGSGVRRIARLAFVVGVPMSAIATMLPAAETGWLLLPLVAVLGTLTAVWLTAWTTAAAIARSERRAAVSNSTTAR